MEFEDIRIDEEFRSLIPPLSDEELRDLHRSLKADGCISPLVVWYEQKILLDGHNRFEYCQANDIECEIHEICIPNRDAAKAWIIRHQLGRRNINESQRAMLAIVLEAIFSVEAKQRHDEQARRNLPNSPTVANLPPSGETPEKKAFSTASESQSLNVANLPTSEKAKARDEAADAMNVSPRLVQMAKKVQQSGTEKLQDAVRRGEVSVSAAAKVATLPPAQQDRAVDGGKKQVAKAAAEIRRKKNPKGGIAPDAFKPIRGHSRTEAKTALELPHDPEAAARTLMSVFDAEYLKSLIKSLQTQLKGTST